MMNKHRGTNFDDYLKEKGILEEISALAKQRWEILCVETQDALENTTDIQDSILSYSNRTFIHGPLASYSPNIPIELHISSNHAKSYYFFNK